MVVDAAVVDAGDVRSEGRQVVVVVAVDVVRFGGGGVVEGQDVAGGEVGREGGEAVGDLQDWAARAAVADVEDVPVVAVGRGCWDLGLRQVLDGEDLRGAEGGGLSGGVGAEGCVGVEGGLAAEGLREGAGGEGHLLELGVDAVVPVDVVFHDKSGREVLVDDATLCQHLESAVANRRSIHTAAMHWRVLSTSSIDLSSWCCNANSDLSILA